MAVIKTSSKNDFIVAAQYNTNPGTHIMVTDEATFAWLVPIVTSQHRHYIYFEGNEEDVQALVAWARENKYKVVRGKVELKNG